MFKPSEVVASRFRGKVKISFDKIIGNDDPIDSDEKLHLARFIVGEVATQIERSHTEHVRWLFPAYLEFIPGTHSPESAKKMYASAVNKAADLIQIESEITNSNSLESLRLSVKSYVLSLPDGDTPYKRKIRSTAVNRMLARIPTFGGLPPTNFQVNKALKEHPGVVISHSPLKIMVMSEDGIHIVDRKFK